MKRNNQMKKIIAAVLLSLLIFTGICAAQKNELTPITFSLDWTPNTNHTGVYAAKALGYYEEAGLDVQIVRKNIGRNEGFAFLGK